jgi:hypothetical protein
VETFNNPWDCAPVGATFDFLEVTGINRDVVTNPPFSVAEDFVRHALELTKPRMGKVAMLLEKNFRLGILRKGVVCRDSGGRSR